MHATAPAGSPRSNCHQRPGHRIRGNQRPGPQQHSPAHADPEWELAASALFVGACSFSRNYTFTSMFKMKLKHWCELCASHKLLNRDFATDIWHDTLGESKNAGVGADQNERLGACDPLARQARLDLMQLLIAPCTHILIALYPITQVRDLHPACWGSARKEMVETVGYSFFRSVLLPAACAKAAVTVPDFLQSVVGKAFKGNVLYSMATFGDAQKEYVAACEELGTVTHEEFRQMARLLSTTNSVGILRTMESLCVILQLDTPASLSGKNRYAAAMQAEFKKDIEAVVLRLQRYDQNAMPEEVRRELKHLASSSYVDGGTSQGVVAEVSCACAALARWVWTAHRLHLTSR